MTKLFYIICFVSFSLGINGQIISSKSWFPDIDDLIVTYDASNNGSFPPGQGGNGVSWDFTSAVEMEDSREETKFVDPLTLQGVVNFSDATIASINETTGAEYFYKEGEDSFELLGYVDGNSFVYEDPFMIWKLPFEFQELWIDDFVLNEYDASGNLVATVFGTNQHFFDGNGTLTNHEGTFDDIFRIRTRRTLFPGEVNESSETTYNFYKGKASNRLASYFSSPGGSPPPRFTWGGECNLLSTSNTDIDNVIVDVQYKGDSYFIITTESSAIQHFTIYNFAGQQVSETITNTRDGQIDLTFSTDLQKGQLYFLKIENEGVKELYTTSFLSW